MRKAFAAFVAVLALAGCTATPHKKDKTPPPSDLSGKPAAIAVDPGPFESGPVRPPGRGALVGAWIKPAELTHVGRLAAVDTLENDLGRRLSIINTYRRFEQPVGTASDQEFLAGGATLMVSWATGDNRSILDGDYDDLIRKQAVAIRRMARACLRIR